MISDSIYTNKKIKEREEVKDWEKNEIRALYLSISRT